MTELEISIRAPNERSDVSDLDSVELDEKISIRAPNERSDVRQVSRRRK